jgi:hypothetical protein
MVGYERKLYFRLMTNDCKMVLGKRPVLKHRVRAIVSALRSGHHSGGFLPSGGWIPVGQRPVYDNQAPTPPVYTDCRNRICARQRCSYGAGLSTWARRYGQIGSEVSFHHIPGRVQLAESAPGISDRFQRYLQTGFSCRPIAVLHNPEDAVCSPAYAGGEERGY